VFEIRGKINGQENHLVFHDGKVTGDEQAVSRFLAESRVDHGRLGLGNEMWSFKDGYLNSDFPARDLAVSFVFDEVDSFKDDWPPLNPRAVY